MRLAIFAILLGMGSWAFAHENHTEEVCHPSHQQLCVHLGYDQAPQLEEEFQFVAHVVAPANVLAQVRGVKVDLWMDMGSGHGHGSAPVSVQRLNTDHFLVKEAFFVMPGVWLVRVNVIVGQKTYNFSFPFEVKP